MIKKIDSKIAAMAIMVGMLTLVVGIVFTQLLNLH